MTQQLVYDGWMPQANALLRMNGWRLKQRLRKNAVAQFGALPGSVRTLRPAIVEVVRVLGPHQREMDSGNLALVLKPLEDALVYCGYLVDDSPQWATFSRKEDATRRRDGPKIEISIWYP